MSVQAVRDFLAADATLALLRPGGFHIGEELTRQQHPAAFDEFGEVLPCVLVNGGESRPDGPLLMAEAQLVNVWLYHRTSDAANATAAARVKALLHRNPLPRTYDMTWAFGGQPFYEEALAARAVVHRFEIKRRM